MVGEFNGQTANNARTIDTAATSRNVGGLLFDDSGVAGDGFTFTTTSTTAGIVQVRPYGIVNNDADTQTFKTEVKMFSYSASSNAPSIFNAAAGNLVFQGGAQAVTVDNNGGALTVDGAHNTTIGNGSTGGGGIMTGAGSLIKNGTGTLTLGGTAANTYLGGTIVNSGTVTANKANAFGTGHLTVNSSGIVNIGANNQTVGAVTNAGGTINGTGTITATAYHFSGGTVNAKLAGNANLRHSSGTTTIGGTSPNTFVGTISLEGGTVIAAKDAALGTGNNVTMSGDSTFVAGGFAQAFGTLSLAGNATLDFSGGDGTVSFADSSAFDWSTFTLTIMNYTVGDVLQFGTDGNGLTQAQLDHIIFDGYTGDQASIDAFGKLAPVPVPEPSTMALGIFGGFGVLFMFRRVRGKK
jgi:autotransporter-associated beta strand protein